MDQLLALFEFVPHFFFVVRFTTYFFELLFMLSVLKASLAFGKDVLLIKSGSSLAQVMQKMWTRFGKPFIGYEFANFENAVYEEFADTANIKEFIQSFVHGYGIYLPSYLLFSQRSVSK